MIKDCALEGCEKTFEAPGFWSLAPDKWTRIGMSVHFCSRECLEGYLDWCVWQKEMGNGIESQPPIYGGQLKEKYFNQFHGFIKKTKGGE